MKALELKIDWMHGWSNPPGVKMVVDDIPSRSEMRFKREGDLYWAEKDGLVRQFTWGGGEQRGFGGRDIPITLENGEQVVLKGPWSGSATLGVDPSNDMPLHVDVSLMRRDYQVERYGDEERVWTAWRRGFTFVACKVTVDWLQDAFEEHVDERTVALVPTRGGRFVPTYFGPEERDIALDHGMELGEFIEELTAQNVPDDPGYEAGRLSTEQQVVVTGVRDDGIAGNKPPPPIARGLACTYRNSRNL